MAILQFFKNSLIACLCVFLILGAAPPLAYSQDTDGDNILDEFDNCLEVPNGPLGGTCIKGTLGDPCMSDAECGDGGFCSMNQEDTYPPQADGIGDACDCAADFDCDGDVDADDVETFLVDFGRFQFNNPCANDDPCHGDFLCDGDVDALDVEKFLEDFGRFQFNDPCPSCEMGTWCTYLPPDPADVAPPFDQTVATNMFDATEFLYTGDNPIQTGMDPDTINPVRVAVIRGKVLDRENNPLPGVIITILNQSEYGQTLSREDGMFDLAVNGGGLLTISYKKNEYLPAQRQINAPWQDYVWLPDVVMIPLDPQATTIDLTSIEPIQTAQGSIVTDDDGTRQATMLIPQGISAELVLPGGSTQPINVLSVRATEYTIGQNGPNMMPAILPPNSGYTYAVEFTADEALSAGAIDVQFDQPIYSYVENFIGFPVGESVPAGYYDKERGVWVPSDNGRVIEILSITGGLADLDTDGDASADDPATLATLGITNAEREKLANIYVPGQSLWRVPITHFTPWDWNWPFSPPDDAEPPQESPPEDDDPEEETCEVESSIIECQNQILGERIPIIGTPFTLNYRSDRVPGRFNTLAIPLIGDNVLPSLKVIKLEIYVAGRQFTENFFSPSPNQLYTFVWDGKDAYDRTVQGKQPVTVNISYGYQGLYNNSNFNFLRAFAASSGVSIEGVETRQEVWFSQRWGGLTVGGWDGRGFGLGGWSIDAYNLYDPIDRKLYLGTGKRRSAHNFNRIITTVAGNGTQGYSGDGGPATEAQLYEPRGIAVGPDGSFYIADRARHVIRQVTPDGIITTVAGNGTYGYSGDGGPATEAQLASPNDLTLAPDGSLYIADSNNDAIRRVDPDGIITTVVGNTNCTGIIGDNGPATEAELCNPEDVVMAPDGSLYIVEDGYDVIRRVSPDGIITTVAGNGTGGFSGDGGPATEAQLDSPDRVAIAPDGSFYIVDAYNNNRIRKVDLNGIITTVAGGGTLGDICSSDGELATNVTLDEEYGIDVGPDGSLYLSDDYLRCVVRVGPNGIINTVAGNGTQGYSGDGGPATAAQLNGPIDVAVAPDGSLYIADRQNHVIRQVTSAFPGFSDEDLVIPSEDGNMIYVFNSSGRHLRTLHALTGATLYQFDYDSNGLLIQIEDGDGNITTIERDVDGNPTGILGPYGQRTELSLDSNGYLKSITNPAAEDFQFSYTTDGLLTEMTDPNENTVLYTYDALGRLIRTDDPAGGFKTLTRTDIDNGYQVSVTTAMGRTNNYSVEHLSTGEKHMVNTIGCCGQIEVLVGTDGSGVITFPDGIVTEFVENPDPRFGMLTPTKSMTVTTPSGCQLSVTKETDVSLANPFNPFSFTSITDYLHVNNTTFVSEYDPATRIFTRTTPEGRQFISTIDTKGRVVAEQVTGLAPMTYSYDSRGRPETIVQGLGGDARVLTFEHDTSPTDDGYVDRVTGPEMFTFTFDLYDAAGRLKILEMPDTEQIFFGYDAKGNTISLTPPEQPPHSFTYTPVDLIETYVPPDVSGGTNSTLYDYNADRQIELETRPDGKQISYVYDPVMRRLNRVAAYESDIEIQSINLQYYPPSHPSDGHLASITTNDNEALSFSYDGFFIINSTWAGTINGSVGHIYNDYFDIESENINGSYEVSFGYDLDRLLIQAGVLSLYRDDPAVPETKNGMLRGTELSNIITAIEYNQFAELKDYSAVLHDAGGDITIFEIHYTVRDKHGRIKEKTETIDGPTKTYNYDYDSVGQLRKVYENSVLVREYDYDANGNRLIYDGGGSLDVEYDAQNRLLRYGGTSYTYTPNGELSTKTVGVDTTTYNYDVFGNLRAVTLPDGTQIEYVVDGLNRRIGKKVNGTLIQGFLYKDGLNPVAELDGSGNLAARFVYGTKPNIPDYMEKGGNTYRIISDHLGSPRLVVNVDTGEIAQQIDYDEFGNVTQDTNIGFQPFGFAGGIYDSDTKLVRFGARDYDSETGRWTTKDPILFKGGQTNLYVYVGNNPINLIDPTGLTTWCKDTPLGMSKQKGVRCDREVTKPCQPSIHKCYDINGKVTTEHTDQISPVSGVDANGFCIYDLKGAWDHLLKEAWPVKNPNLSNILDKIPLPITVGVPGDGGLGVGLEIRF